MTHLDSIASFRLNGFASAKINPDLTPSSSRPDPSAITAARNAQVQLRSSTGLWRRRCFSPGLLRQGVGCTTGRGRQDLANSGKYFQSP